MYAFIWRIKILTKGTSSHYEELLPDEFLRIHRSFVVNKPAITAFTAHDVEVGTKEIPIGVSYKKSVASNLEGTS